MGVKGKTEDNSLPGGIYPRALQLGVSFNSRACDLSRKSFIIGFISCLLFVGCAGFSYHYYGMSQVIYDHGVLLGPKASDDLPFSRCSPNEESKYNCVVMFAKDFFALKQDFEDTKLKLIDCEKR